MVKIKDITFVAFDVETTGLTVGKDRIIEIGCVKFRETKVVDTFQELVDPRKPIPFDATFVNGITNDMVKGKPTIEQILPRFLSFIGDAVKVAHNVPFDMGFISCDLNKFGLKIINTPILDTCSITKQVFPGLNSYSLESLARYLSIKSEKFHRALEDSVVCMKIFLKCLTKIGNLDYLTLKDILDGSSLNPDIGKILLQNKFKPLKSALESGSRIQINYRDVRGAVTNREIKPLAANFFRGSPVIEAFCYLRKANRHFRLDRIIKIK